MRPVRPSIRKLKTEEHLKLDDIPHGEPAYCWQIFAAGHWCGASSDDRWSSNKEQVLTNMKHSLYPHRLVYCEQFSSVLKNGPTLEPAR